MHAASDALPVRPGGPEEIVPRAASVPAFTINPSFLVELFVHDMPQPVATWSTKTPDSGKLKNYPTRISFASRLLEVDEVCPWSLASMS